MHNKLVILTELIYFIYFCTWKSSSKIEVVNMTWLKNVSYRVFQKHCSLSVVLQSICFQLSQLIWNPLTEFSRFAMFKAQDGLRQLSFTYTSLYRAFAYVCVFVCLWACMHVRVVQKHLCASVCGSSELTLSVFLSHSPLHSVIEPGYLEDATARRFY